jgi:hypothetical protein
MKNNHLTRRRPFLPIEQMDRLELAVVNNFRAVSAPGKSFRRSRIKQRFSDHEDAIPTAKMAGFAAIVLQVRFCGAVVVSFVNHSATSGGTRAF